METKICFITNIIPNYRQAIYKLMDMEWDIEWFTGKTKNGIEDIKRLSNNDLKHINWIVNQQLLSNWYWQNGAAKAMRGNRYTHYVMTGEIYCLSTWWNLIQHILFYRKKKVYLWSHGWYGRETLTKKWLKRIFFGMADKVFTYGNYAKDRAIEQGFKADKIIPIHNSLDHSHQVEIRKILTPSDLYTNHFKNSFPTLIFIGRLTTVKRLDLLLEALYLLKKDGNLYNLVLIGDGKEKEKLKQQTLDLGLSDHVWFYGPCYDDIENAQFIYNADLCVAPGNVGLTAMHTMVFGTPVLTHDDFTWQMPEFEAIIPEKTGAFFKRNDINSLTNEIQRWFDTHKNERENIREACYKEIDTNWTPEYQLEVLKSVFNN
ncbi:MAG: glycosyltransferase [Muribaculaceae bacterium]|nr:glycosyltransferase [Muribaculaceae bacterium]